MKKCKRVIYYRSEGFALTGYDIPGCVEDGAWMLWENSSVVVAAVAVAVARPPARPPGFGKWPLLEFYYGIGASGVRGSIRLVERLPKVYITSYKNNVKKSNIKKELEND